MESSLLSNSFMFKQREVQEIQFSTQYLVAFPVAELKPKHFLSCVDTYLLSLIHDRFL